LETLKVRVTSVEDVLNGFKKQIAMLDDKVRQMGKASALSGNPAMAGGLMDEMEQGLAQLRKDFEQHKSQNLREHDEFRQLFDQAASKDDLAQLEERMMQRLQDLIDQLKNLIPDKEALKKKIAALEKSLKQLYDMIMALQEQKPEEENAMFSKKYVGPANCASCDKGITNLIGQPADHHVWKRLPFREPSERIARYG